MDYKTKDRTFAGKTRKVTTGFEILEGREQPFSMQVGLDIPGHDRDQGSLRFVDPNKRTDLLRAFGFTKDHKYYPPTGSTLYSATLAGVVGQDGTRAHLRITPCALPTDPQTNTEHYNVELAAYNRDNERVPISGLGGLAEALTFFLESPANYTPRPVDKQ